ncbi:toxin-antitoxin system YwqK family antitoxin [Ekhidna sp.]|uniref:toxin-antitoxin system YwqK family antitoxin n=1 Tax=Ekhidna sp. TaxID=2608089 RepID=UPI003B598479
MLRVSGYITIIFSIAFAQAQIKQGKNYYDSDSTNISEVYHYSIQDSMLNGEYESFYLNGSLKTYGWYKNNQPDSIWKYFYENGRKKAEGRFKNGIPSGYWRYYFENGNLKSEGILRGNSKEGHWKFYYENDGEKSNGEYANNSKTGIWNYFYEDGSLKAQSIIENGLGQYTEFYPSGARRMEGTNRNDKSEGEWIYYYESGELEAIGEFSNGLKTGVWTYYHKNGEKAAIGNFYKGQRNGEWEYYHQNGKLSQSGKIAEDEKDGYWKLFYPTGEMLGEVTFDEGDGMFNEYYPSGNQKSKGQIIDGEKTGKWYYYSEKGQLEGEADLKKGAGEYIGYYPDGSIKMKGQVKDDKRVGEWTLYNPDGSTAGTYRPIYENTQPIFKTRITQDAENKESLDKPNYHPEKRGLRYFLPRVNEYKGFIIASNPVWLLDEQLPIAIEYYIQERLGYELQFDIIRSPFFTPDEKIGDYQVYSRGVKIHFRQKFYHADSKLGMFYFGHEVNFKYLSNKVNHLDTLRNPPPQLKGNLIETSYGYGLFIGNRWMKDVGSSGLTIDAFLGVGVASRSYKEDYAPSQLSLLDERLDPYFSDDIKSSVHFPIIIGLNIGFAVTKSKSKTQ